MAKVTVGGQAVIEGVMMRSADRISTAVRRMDGSIQVKTEDYRSYTQRIKALGWPFFRGVVTFLEMTVIGTKTLMFSADTAVVDAERQEAAEKGIEYKGEEKKSTKLVLALTVTFSLVVGIGMFVFLPLWIASLTGAGRDALTFNLVAGGIRTAILIGYMSALLLSDEFKRIFEYHGAEHKAITAWENKSELVPEKVAKFTRFHPRCGTSFLLIVALNSVLVYAIADTLFAKVTGAAPTLLQRFPFHFSLLPLVAAISYEVLRFSGKTSENPITKIMIQPGLWLQRITTREPDHTQLEVAIVALEEALAKEDSALKVNKVMV